MPISQEDAKKYKEFFDKQHAHIEDQKLKGKARKAAAKELISDHLSEYRALVDENYKKLARIGKHDDS